MTVNMLHAMTYIDIDCPVGNSTGEAIDTFVLRHGDPCVASPGSNIQTSSVQWQAWRGMLAQAAGVWAHTAGRHLYTLSPPSEVLGTHGQYSTGTNYLQYMTLTLGGDLANYIKYGGDNPAGDYGVFAFTYGGYADNWQRLTFSKQICFPSHARCDGFLWFLRPGVTASLKTFQRAPGDAGIDVIAVGEIDLETNLTDGLIDRLEAISDAQNLRGNPVKVVGTDTDGNLVNLTRTSNANGPATADGRYSTSNTTALINSYLSEAWQCVAAPDSGDGDVATTLGGNGVLSWTGKYAHSAALDLSGGDYDPSTYVGKLPFRYFGCVAFDWSGFRGNLRYLNSAFPLVRPEALGATGLWYAFKPNVTAATTIKTTTGLVKSALTGSTPINLCGGMTSGIQLP